MSIQDALMDVSYVLAGVRIEIERAARRFGDGSMLGSTMSRPERLAVILEELVREYALPGEPEVVVSRLEAALVACLGKSDRNRCA